MTEFVSASLATKYAAASIGSAKRSLVEDLGTQWSAGGQFAQRGRQANLCAQPRDLDRRARGVYDAREHIRVLVERRIAQDGAERDIAPPHERHAVVALGRDLRGPPRRAGIARLAGQRENELERRIAESIGENPADLLGRRATGAQVGEVLLDAAAGPRSGPG